MPENIIPRKVTSMGEIHNKKIVQHNDLITSVAQMTSTPLKFFELAVACLDTDNVPKDRTVRVSKELLFSFFDAKSESKHTYFKDTLLKMHEQAVFYVSELDEEEELYEYRIINPLEKTSWDNYNDEVSFQFTESIMPFLIELKNNFTQYLLSDIGKLDSKHSIILYKWLSMNFNQYEHYEHKGSRTKEQLEMLKNPIISVKELRRITNTEKSYSRMSNFTRWVLDEATKEITEKTFFNVEYQKIKKGGRISDIKFFISKKHVAKNEFYKEEQQDPAYLEDKKNKEKEAESLYVEAIGSKYTDLLGDYKLITFSDLRDKEIMAGLQKSVYPLYDELTKLRGTKGVEKHISYVASRKEEYTKRNIVRYLYESISNYIPRVKVENNPESMFDGL